MESSDRIKGEGSGCDGSHAEDDRWADWPTCPHCGRRRQTRCPTCDLGGDDFSLAEFIPAAESLPVTKGCSSCGSGGHVNRPVSERDFGVLLMCPACEEAFSPTFYRLCEQCGHDFGDGLSVDVTGSDRVTDRALLVLAVLIVLGAAMLGYFWYLFG